MIKTVIILIVYILFLIGIILFQRKKPNSKLWLLILASITIFTIQFVTLFKTNILLIIKSEENINSTDIISMIIDIASLCLALFIEIHNNHKQKQNYKILYFDHLDIINPHFDTIPKVELILKTDQNVLPPQYEIIPKEIDFFIILVQELFYDDELFEIHKNDEQYIRKITISHIDKIKIERGNNFTNYHIYANDNIDNFKDILSPNAPNFADKTMLKLNFKYKLVKSNKKFINQLMKVFILKLNLLDEVTSTFKMQTCANNRFLYSNKNNIKE